MAFTCLFIYGWTGPLDFENTFNPQGDILLDTIIWSGINIFIHVALSIRMYWDERPITSLSEEEEALWRFIYRHSGLSKTQFHGSISPELQILSFEKNEQIPLEDVCYIILEGKVNLEIMKESSTGLVREHASIYSGHMFPLQHMNIDNMAQPKLFSRSSVNPVAATM